ncbi:MAG: efflux RND transporter periplasmic adaptor subunit [Magnetococcales bacterium]|nr:efflux RND transporter periplasmic adaptor subunit [Magnetococcales bacterium]
MDHRIVTVLNGCRQKKPLPWWFWLVLLLPVGLAHGGEEEWRTRALLAARRETVLSARLTGRVEKLAVKEGDAIRANQVLMHMDCGVHEARLARAEAELSAARFKLEVQQRLEKLQSGSALEVGLAGAEVKKCEADLAEARIVVGMCVVHAPFDGRVSAVKVGLHQSVTQGMPLVEILEDAALEVRLIVPSRWLAWLKEGTPFTLRLDETGREYAGTVVRLAARIDPASQSLGVTGGMTGKRDGVLVGMSGTALFAPPSIP